MKNGIIPGLKNETPDYVGNLFRDIKDNINLLKSCDSLISFLIRHFLLLNSTDLVVLVYLRACIDVNWNDWSLICKNVIQKVYSLRSIQ